MKLGVRTCGTKNPNNPPTQKNQNENSRWYYKNWINFIFSLFLSLDIDGPQATRFSSEEDIHFLRFHNPNEISYRIILNNMFVQTTIVLRSTLFYFFFIFEHPNKFKTCLFQFFFVFVFCFVLFCFVLFCFF